MKIAILTFTEHGVRIMRTLCEKLNNHSCAGFVKGKAKEQGAQAGFSQLEGSLQEETKELFGSMDALIFISACGIAVRACAPFIRDKKKDPAVLVIDEQGQFVISLLSGHVGGANELAMEAAEILHAQPVITTATDAQGKFAVDVFAKQNHLWLTDWSLAKRISAEIVSGNRVGFLCEKDIEEKLPSGLSDSRHTKQLPEYGIYVGEEKKEPYRHTLWLRPKNLVLGLGCKKETDFSVFEQTIREVLKEAGFDLEQAGMAASVDLKKEEPCMKELAKRYALQFVTYTAEELLAVPGDFTASSFVQSVTGVDNVCERSAVKASGNPALLLKKTAKNGVTVSIGRKDWRIHFNE